MSSCFVAWQLCSSLFPKFVGYLQGFCFACPLSNLPSSGSSTSVFLQRINLHVILNPDSPSSLVPGLSTWPQLLQSAHSVLFLCPSLPQWLVEEWLCDLSWANLCQPWNVARNIGKKRFFSGNTVLLKYKFRAAGDNFTSTKGNEVGIHLGGRQGGQGVRTWARWRRHRVGGKGSSDVVQGVRPKANKCVLRVAVTWAEVFEPSAEIWAPVTLFKYNLFSCRVT